MEHIVSAKSLKQWQLASCPHLVAGLVTLQLFQNCFPRIYGISLCFHVFGVVMPLFKTLSERTLLSTSQDTGLPLLLAKKYHCFQLQLNFLYSSDTSLLTLIFC